MARKKLTKNTAKGYAAYGLTGLFLFGKPANKMTAVRAFFESLKYLIDDE